MSALTDLRALIAATPGVVAVGFGAFTCQGILDFEGQGWGAPGQSQVDVEVISLNYPYPDLPGLVIGAPITLDGVAYTVTNGPRRKADGLEAVVLLEAA